MSSKLAYWKFSLSSSDFKGSLSSVKKCSRLQLSETLESGSWANTSSLDRAKNGRMMEIDSYARTSGRTSISMGWYSMVLISKIFVISELMARFALIW